MRNRILTRGGKFRVGLLAVLVVGANTYAATVISKRNPYAKTIVDRNIFNLSKAVPAEVIVLPPAPPSWITLQGVTTIGRRQVLFKLHVPPRPGEPARETFYVLSEGQCEGGIEVLAIDERTGTVRFNNHGIVQTLSLQNDGDKVRFLKP